MKLPAFISRIIPSTRSKQGGSGSSSDWHPFRYFPRSDLLTSGYAITSLSGEQHRALLLARDPMSSALITIGIRTIAAAIAEVRFNVHDQSDRQLDNHPAARILDHAAGNWTRSDIAWTITEGLLLAGNCILIPQPDGYIRAIDWRNCQLPTTGAGPGPANYRIHNHFTGTFADYSYEGVAHLRYRRAPDGINGLGLVAQTVLAELATDAQAAEYTLALLANTAAFGNIIIPADDAHAGLTQQIVDDMQQSVDWLYTGSGRGQSLVTARKWQVLQPAGLGQRGIDLSPIRNVTEERLLATLGIPPALVGIGVGKQNTRYGSGLEQHRRLLASSVIIPLAHHIADQLSAELLPFYPGSDGLRFVPDFAGCAIANEVRQHIQSQQTDRIIKLISAGVVTPEEAREHLDAVDALW